MLLDLAWLAVIVHILATWVHDATRGARARRQMAQAHWRIQRLPTFRLEDGFDAGAGHAGAEQPPASILVPAWCERGTIEKCIRSLLQLEYPKWEAFILAGGPDGTYEAARLACAGDPRIVVLERGPEPKNAAINRGVKAAHNDIVVLLDADSIVEPGWLAALVEPLTSGAAASIGMHLPARMTWVSVGEHMEVLQAYGILGTILGQGCSSLAVRRETLEKIGALPVNAFSWEDADIGVRLAQAGEKVAFAPLAHLRNERPASLGEYWATAIRVHRAHLALLWNWRRALMRRPKWMLFECYFHVFSAILLAGAILALAVALAAPAAVGTVGQIAALVLLWMLGRRAGLAAEIAAYTGEAKWLLRAWIPPVLLLVQVITANIGLFTVARAVPFDYKGRREGQGAAGASGGGANP